MKKNYIPSILFFVIGLLFSFTAQAQLVAHPDSGIVTHSNNVQIAIPNVLANDTLGGIPVTLSEVTVSQISSSSLNISLQPNGSVIVNAGASQGWYQISYQICETAAPNNCTESYASVQVLPEPFVPIVVGPDAVTISTGLTPPQIILENVLANDTLGGIPITLSDVHIVNQVSSTATYFNLDTSTANVSVIGSPPPGTYTITYYYCSNSQPNNCVSATAVITVINSLSTTVNASYQDFNGDGVTNVGDVINYTYTINNIGSVAVSNISITSSEVNINGGPPIPLLNPGANNSSTYTGVHAITQADINNGNVIVAIQTNGTRSGNPISVSSTNSFHLNLSNGVKLNAFIDYNGNGTQESGEPAFTYGSFQIELNNNGTVHNVISPNGVHYLYESNPTNSYDFGYTIDPQFANQYNVAVASYPNVTVANGSGVVTYNFAVTVLPYSDLYITLYATGQPRPGFSYYQYIYYGNYGNQPIASGTVTFAHHPGLTLNGTSQTGTTPTANGFTYNFTNLLPGQTRVISVYMTVATIPTVNLGDLITNTATITTPANDIHPNNNTSSQTQVAVGSYDPNDKSESHGPQIQHSSFTSDDYLTYTIRFENTGTAEAINIRVNDVLDSKLDETTVRMVAASHAYVLDRVGSNLTWRFNGVNLEPSVPNDPITGHGYVVFQVKPKAGYVIGDVIPNTANIYFDFNPAIVTNTWSTTFVPFLGVSHFAFSNFNYHPNPVKNSLMLSNDTTIDNVEIISVLGQRIKSVPVNSLQTEIDLSDLAHGVYFVKASSNGQEKTVKIIKE